MSVTFTAVQHDSDILGYALSCACGDNRSARVADTYQAAVTLLGEATPACADDYCTGEQGWAVPLMAFEAPSINISNTNARFVLDALGIQSDDLTGELAADLFLGRVLTALAIAPVDEGTLAYEVAGGGRAAMVMCGRRPGYLQETLTDLHEVTQWAQTHQRDVTWG